MWPRLADLAAAYKQAHWNVLGPGLTELHPLFERFAEQTRAYVDLVAERAVSLGGAACSALTSFPIDERDGRALLQELSRRVERTAEELRRAIRSSAEDPVTQDCYIEIARGIEKQRWMLLAHLKDRDESPGRHA